MLHLEIRVDRNRCPVCVELFGDLQFPIGVVRDARTHCIEIRQHIVGRIIVEFLGYRRYALTLELLQNDLPVEGLRLSLQEIVDGRSAYLVQSIVISGHARGVRRLQLAVLRIYDLLFGCRIFCRTRTCQSLLAAGLTVSSADTTNS